MNMNNINIDTDALNSAKEKLIQKKEKLNTLLTALKNENNDLKNYWETKTSDSVFSNFEVFFKSFQTSIENLDNDIKFLEKTINSYVLTEKEIGKEVDEKIAL